MICEGVQPFDLLGAAFDFTHGKRGMSGRPSPQMRLLQSNFMQKRGCAVR